MKIKPLRSFHAPAMRGCQRSADQARFKPPREGIPHLGLTARLVPTANGTRVEVEQDLQLSGAAAQYGRGMISDVSAVMMRDFATNIQTRIDAYDRGVSPDQIETKSAGGFGIAMQAAWMALKRVGRRFFLPYEPNRI